jgi:hypothetical protein
MGTFCKTNFFPSFSYYIKLFICLSFYNNSGSNTNRNGIVFCLILDIYISFFFFQIEGDGDDAVVTNIEGPGRTQQMICTIGRLFVLAGAIHKGKSEYNEMTSLGFRKYCQTTVK